MRKSWWIWTGVVVAALLIGGGLWLSGGGGGGNVRVEIKKPSEAEKELQSIKVAASDGELKEAEKGEGGWTVRVEEDAKEVKLDKLLEQSVKFFRDLDRAHVDVALAGFVASTGSLKDKWGNTLKKVPVLRVELKKDAFEKVNWQGIDPKNIPRVADMFWMHDVVKEEAMKSQSSQGGGQGSSGGKSGGQSGGSS